MKICELIKFFTLIFIVLGMCVQIIWQIIWRVEVFTDKPDYFQLHLTVKADDIPIEKSCTLPDNEVGECVAYYLVSFKSIAAW